MPLSREGFGYQWLPLPNGKGEGGQTDMFMFICLSLDSTLTTLFFASPVMAFFIKNANR